MTEGRTWRHTLRHVVERSADRRSPKPLLRGWFHGVSAIGAVFATVGLVVETYVDSRKLLALLIFGLSMVALYSVSSIYHLGTWQGRRYTIVRAMDHACIFLLIAGTYTPICVIVLGDRLGVFVLTLIWGLATVGMSCAVLTLRLPRWAVVAQYIGMGSLALIPLPRLWHALPAQATAVFALGGILYAIGAVIYALRRPNPWPRFFGFHELFHLFVIAGSTAFLIGIWRWVVPFTLA
jgi:hemolysin III